MSSDILKKLSIAAGLLLVLWLVYLYRQMPHSHTPFSKASDKAARILLSQGAKKLELQKQTDGWKVLAIGMTYPADDAVVATFLASLDGVQVEDEMSDRADRAAEYEVNTDSGTLVQAFATGGAKFGEGMFGKQAPDLAHIYFRYVDKPNVYLASGIFRGDFSNVEAKNWRSRQLVTIPETKIDGITIEANGFGTILNRTSTDTWSLGGRVVDPAPVNALIGALAHLRAEDFVDPAAFPAVTFDSLTFAHILIQGSERPGELFVGNQDPKSKRYPISAGKEAGLAWISENSTQAILKKPSAFEKK